MDPVRILIINGPNLNMLGVREPHIYGTLTLDEINRRIVEEARQLECEVVFFQSNHEGAIVDTIQQHLGKVDGAILNPGGLTQYGVSVHDAMKAVDYPFVEVHLSNIHAREPWRGHSIISPAAMGVVQGLGWRGYLAALRALVSIVRERRNGTSSE